MPGFLVHLGAQVTCFHAGQAKPTMPNPRVTVSGQPTVLITSPYLITGCAFPPPPTANGPCVSGQFLSGTVRVLSMGQPLVVMSSQGPCVPTGTPLLILAAQLRATAI